MQSSQQRDRLWKLFNEDLQKHMKSGDFYSLGSTYYEMANFVKEEGKDNAYLLKLGYEAKLKFQKDRLNEYKKSEVCVGVEIISAGENDACDVCKQLDGKVFAMKEALSKNPLPVKDCTHEYGCRCVYGGSF
jgi:hypothetical protein